MTVEVERAGDMRSYLRFTQLRADDLSPNLKPVAPGPEQSQGGARQCQGTNILARPVQTSAPPNGHKLTDNDVRQK